MIYTGKMDSKLRYSITLFREKNKGNCLLFFFAEEKDYETVGCNFNP